MRADPYILFLPVSFTTGIGEYVRSLTLAQAISERWPGARIKFILNRAAPYVNETPFDALLVDGSATFNIDAVNTLIREERPDLVVFDNAGRVAQLSCANEVGARTVFISARPQKRRKAFAWRWLSRLDQHWITNLPASDSGLSFWERTKLRAARDTDVLLFHSIFPEPDPQRGKALRQKLGLLDSPYILFVVGGGGWSTDGIPTAEIFAEAAGRVSAKTGLPTVVVMGPLYQGTLPELPGVITVPSLRSEELIDLISDARLLALGGGSIVNQALALGKVCVAATAGAPDQKRRIRRMAELGLIESAQPTPESLSNGVLALHGDTGRAQAMQARVDRAGVKNGLHRALDAVEQLLSDTKPEDRER